MICFRIGRLLCLAPLAVMLMDAPCVRAADINGVARVIDGDTIQIDGTHIRLFGIDAPERRQSCHHHGEGYPCGERARAALIQLLGNDSVECTASGIDRYRRVVAVCFIRGADIGRAMVEQGWALAYRRYSRDYVNAEAEARRDARGIWSGTFVPPWSYRKTKKD